MNIFQKDIRPEWEDNNNKKGNILTLSYTIKNEEIDDFLKRDFCQRVKIPLFFPLLQKSGIHAAEDSESAFNFYRPLQAK